jgi:hypothetical protein
LDYPCRVSSPGHLRDTIETVISGFLCRAQDARFPVTAGTGARCAIKWYHRKGPTDMSDTRTTDSGYRQRSGWAGWVIFAGVMMILMGALHAIDGLVGIFKDEVYYVGANSHLVVSVDYTTWGWVHLIFGLIVLGAGFAVMAGATWARVVGIIVACISVILNFAYMAAFPV